MEKLSNKIECSVCKKNFKEKKNLYGHLRKFHQIEPLLKVKNSYLQCDMCEAKLSRKSSLSRHIKQFHSASEHSYHSSSNKKGRLLCSFTNCFEKFSTHSKLREHLFDNHQINIELEEFIFDSFDDFQKWKNNFQQETHSMYTLDTSAKLLQDGTIKRYYNCHRSFTFKSRGTNKRALKAIGSNKIGKACPSRIEAIEYKLNDVISISVKLWKTHCGHSQEIGRLFLQKEERLEIAEKLKEGASFDFILNSIRDASLCGENVSRITLLKRKDIHNIVRDYNIKHVKRCPQKSDEVTSNARIIEEVMINDENGELFHITPLSSHDQKSGCEQIGEKLELIWTLNNSMLINDEKVSKVHYYLDKIINLLNEEESIQLGIKENVNINTKIIDIMKQENTTKL